MTRADVLRLLAEMRETCAATAESACWGTDDAAATIRALPLPDLAEWYPDGPFDSEDEDPFAHTPGLRNIARAATPRARLLALIESLRAPHETELHDSDASWCPALDGGSCVEQCGAAERNRKIDEIVKLIKEALS